MRGVVPGASRIMSARIRLGSKRNPTGNVPTPPAGKGIWSVPKTFTSVANQITHFMKENFLKDEAASQTPAIQKRTIESDLCCLNDDMISRIVAQVGSEPQHVVATLTRQLGRSLRDSEWPMLQHYYEEHQPEKVVALVNTIRDFSNESIVTKLKYQSNHKDFAEIVFLTIAVQSLTTVETRLLSYLDKTLSSIDGNTVKQEAILITCFTLPKDATTSVQAEQLRHIQAWLECRRVEFGAVVAVLSEPSLRWPEKFPVTASSCTAASAATSSVHSEPSTGDKLIFNDKRQLLVLIDGGNKDPIVLFNARGSLTLWPILLDLLARGRTHQQHLNLSDTDSMRVVNRAVDKSKQTLLRVHPVHPINGHIYFNPPRTVYNGAFVTVLKHAQRGKMSRIRVHGFQNHTGWIRSQYLHRLTKDQIAECKRRCKASSFLEIPPHPVHLVVTNLDPQDWALVSRIYCLRAPPTILTACFHEATAADTAADENAPTPSSRPESKIDFFESKVPNDADTAVAAASPLPPAGPPTPSPTPTSSPTPTLSLSGDKDSGAHAAFQKASAGDNSIDSLDPEFMPMSTGKLSRKSSGIFNSFDGDIKLFRHKLANLEKRKALAEAAGNIETANRLSVFIDQRHTKILSRTGAATVQQNHRGVTCGKPSLVRLKLDRPAAYQSAFSKNLSTLWLKRSTHGHRTVIFFPKPQDLVAVEEEVFQMNHEHAYSSADKQLSARPLVKGTLRVLCKVCPSVCDFLGSAKVYQFTEEKPAPPLRVPGRHATRIAVIALDTLVATYRMSYVLNVNAVALNMANEDIVGGRFDTKMGSQEECIFRNSSIFLSMWPHRKRSDPRLSQHDAQFPRKEPFFPLTSAGAVYSPHVVVVRDIDDDSGLSGPFLSPACWHHVSVISVAAQDLRVYRIRTFKESLTREKLRTLLWVARQNKHEGLVLGAFGCGAFNNKPEKICAIFKDLLENEFEGAFKYVLFAIIKSERNLQAFEKDFKLIENMSDLQKIAPHQKRVSIDSQFIESDSESWSLGPVSMNTNSSTHR